MFRVIKKISFLLSYSEKRDALFLFFLILLMAFLEMIGVVSVMPFMMVLTNIDLIYSNILLNEMFNISIFFGVKTERQFLFFLGFLVMIMLIVSISFKAFTFFFQLRFSERCQYKISTKLLEKYLYQPYSWYLQRNYSTLTKSILSEVGVVISKAINPLITLISHFIVSCVLIVMLIFVDYQTALIIGFVFIFYYFVVYKIFKNFLSKTGKIRFHANKLRFKIVIESFNAFKDVKIKNLEEVFLKRFANQAHLYSKNQALGQLVGQIPRYIIEIIGFGAIMGIILYTISKNNNFIIIIPILSLYVLTGYRLLPAVQSIYNNFTLLRLSESSLDSIYNDFENLKKPIKPSEQQIIDFKENIKLNEVYFNYPGSSRNILKNINIEIKAKSCVGIVGETGSGKTTLVDIILGLLKPQQGKLEVDGKIINESKIISWQKNIGYVPQHIYLIDDTIEGNIAFGLEKNKIDKELIERASKIANLHNFVMTQLPLKYKTLVGENGIRLSGGQRQRIAIARAIYNNPKILIFDEATSALDGLTEKEVMDAINNYGNDATIIMISHRVSTLSNCDKIISINNGEVK